MRSWIRIPVYLVLILALCYALGMQALCSAWFGGLVARALRHRVAAYTGAQVQIGRLRIHPWIWQLELRGVVLRGTESPLQPPLFSAASVVVDLNPLTLSQRKLGLRRLFLEGVAIHVTTGSDGRTNLPARRSSGAHADLVPQLLNLAISSFNMRQATLFWNDQQIPLSVAAENVALLLRFQPGQRYAGSVSSSRLHFSMPDRTLPDVRFSTLVELDASQLRLTELRWMFRGSNGHANVQVSWAQSPEIRADFTARGDLGLLAQQLKLRAVEAGSLRWQGAATLAGGKINSTGRLQVGQVVMRPATFNPGAVDLASHYVLTQSHLRLDGLHLSAMGGTVDGTAEVNLAAPAPVFQLQAAVHRMDLDAAVGAFPSASRALRLLKLSSSVDGKLAASWRGWFNALGIQYDLTLRAPEAGPVNHVPVNGNATGKLQVTPTFNLQIAQAALTTPASSIECDGLLDYAASNLHFKYSTRNFEEARPFLEFVSGPSVTIPLKLQSTAALAGIVTGPAHEPKFNGTLTMGAFNFRGWPWDRFAGRINLSPDSFTVQDGQLVVGKSEMRFSGSTTLANWQFTPASMVQLQALANNSPVEGLRDALGIHYPVQGNISGDLRVGGRAGRLSGGGSVQITRGSIAHEPFDRIALSFLATSSRWKVSQIEFVKGKGVMRGQAGFDVPGKEFTLNLQGEGFSLGQFQRLALRAQPALTQQSINGLDGTANFSLQGKGTFQNPQLHASVTIKGVALNNNPVGDVQLQADWNGKPLTAHAQVVSGNSRILIDANVTSGGDWPMSVHGTVENLKPGPWLQWITGKTLGNQWAASGSLDGSGPLTRPSQITLQMVIARLELGVAGMQWANVRPVHLEYSKGSLDALPFEMQGPSADLRIHGLVQFSGETHFSFEAEGHSDARLLTVFDPGLQTAGGFDVNLHASGTPALPELSGLITVRQLSLGYPQVPFRISGLDGAIRLEHNRATIQSLEGRSGQSKVSLSGYVTFGETPRYNLRAEFDHAILQYPVDFTSVLTGDLSLAGNTDGGRLTGGFVVSQMFVGEDFDVLRWLSRVERAAPAPSLGPNAPLASKIRMDVRVSSDPEVRLESRNLSFVAVIDTRLRGSLIDPVAVGNIHIREGKAIIRGNQYKITRGDVTLTSPFRTTPVMDLEATTRVEHYDLTLEISGPLDGARISYRSDPPLPTEDVLSLLALGYAPQTSEMTATGQEPMAAVGASAVLSQALSTQFSGRAQRIFGVSRIRIDPNVLGPSIAGGARVTIEEQVARDLSITYSTNTGAAQQRDIRLEWNLSDRISMIAERDINGVYGLELRFRKTFR